MNILTAVLVALAQDAPAPAPQCFAISESDVAQELAARFGENEAARRELPAGTLVLYRNPQDKTWTVVFFPRNVAAACPAGSGEGEPPAMFGRDA